MKFKIMFLFPFLFTKSPESNRSPCGEEETQLSHCYSTAKEKKMIGLTQKCERWQKHEFAECSVRAFQNVQQQKWSEEKGIPFENVRALLETASDKVILKYIEKMSCRDALKPAGNIFPLG